MFDFSKTINIFKQSQILQLFIFLQKKAKNQETYQQMMKKSDQGSKNSEESIRSNRSNLRQKLLGSLTGIPKLRKPSQQFKLASSIQTDDSPLILRKGRSRTIDFGVIKQTSNPQIYFQENQLFDDHYQLGQKLGEGGQSIVYQCKNKATGKQFAVKITRTSNEQIIQTIKRAYNMLRKLDHPNIIKVYDLYYDEEQATSYMIMDLCKCSDLRTSIDSELFEKGKFLNKSSNLKEMTKNIIKQISQGVAYLHQNDICHRDIKPQNILFDSQNKLVKIVDFQIAKVKNLTQSSIEMWTDTGSIYYRAPQSFDGGYSKQIDVWAIGIILYEILIGKLPFKSAQKKETIAKIQSLQIDFELLKISQNEKDFLRKTLEKNPQKRVTAKDALQLNYLKLAQIQAIN